MTNDQGKILVGGLLLSALPVWRSGGRGNLNFWEFILNHTIWGLPVEYVPEENYEKAFGITRRF